MYIAVRNTPNMMTDIGLMYHAEVISVRWLMSMPPMPTEMTSIPSVPTMADVELTLARMGPRRQ